jgi:hypothetical protein
MTSAKVVKLVQKEILVNGNIPANTPCSFREKCEIAQAGACKHLGSEHQVEFSCAVARSFDMFA